METHPGHSRTTYEALAANRWRSLWLLMLFPAMLATIVLLGILVVVAAEQGVTDQSINRIGELFFGVIPFVIVGATLWIIIALLTGKRMVLSFAGAKPIKKAEAPELYRLVENLAIQTGIPTPTIYIIEDQSLNAFATGYKPEGAVVAVTRGILERLEKPELAAVLAHEFGHILHRDIRVMFIAVTMVGIIQLISELILRGLFHGMYGGRSDRKSGAGAAGIIFLAAVAIWLIGFLGAMFVQLGLSRRREFMADTESAHLTRHPESLINALQKIAADPRVEVLDGKRSIAAMCIADPLENKRNLLENLQGLFSTHPRVQDRIRALQALV
ncbi:MAG TPA: M48 family metallopeptidase [Candidatus Peribacteraceae bacterium]|nr:M48 family metallopeptidase [Candidatus Peribacteraceae bacterium]